MDDANYIPADKFEGSKEGYRFTTLGDGLGYYKEGYHGPPVAQNDESASEIVTCVFHHFLMCMKLCRACPPPSPPPAYACYVCMWIFLTCPPSGTPSPPLHTCTRTHAPYSYSTRPRTPNRRSTCCTRHAELFRAGPQCTKI